MDTIPLLNAFTPEAPGHLTLSYNFTFSLTIYPALYTN